MSSLPPPMKISPLIKLTRWSLLIAGIFYGRTKQVFLAQREIGIRQEHARKKAIRDAKIKKEKEIQSNKDIEMLSNLATTK